MYLHPYIFSSWGYILLSSNFTNNESSWPTFYIPRNNVQINLSTTIYCNGLIYTYHIFQYFSDFAKLLLNVLSSAAGNEFVNCCYSSRINQNQYRWRICWRCWLMLIFFLEAFAVHNEIRHAARVNICIFLFVPFI